MPALAFCQEKPVADTMPVAATSAMDDLFSDTTVNYDELLDELDLFLDSLLSPRSYFTFSAAGSRGFFNYKNNTGTRVVTRTKFVLSPNVGYYHKSGPGITLAGNIIQNERNQNFNLYQFSVSPSFDFIKQKNWIGGFSYIRYFTKDSVPFYTTPLQNEVNGYFTWRKGWLQPGITASYGWGSRTEYDKRRRYVDLLRFRRFGSLFTSTTTEESIADFSTTVSVRHSFYKMDVGGEKNYFKFTPQLAFTAGTQKFGFNQTSGTYAVNIRNGAYTLYNSGNVNLDDNLKFQPLSLNLSLRPELVISKFFIQPQVVLDYYFPADTDNFNTVFSISAGLLF